MREPLVASHATTWHDGAVALLLPTGEIVGLAAERVGDRYKHSWNSRLAYDYLRERFSDLVFGRRSDHFIDPANGLESDGHHLYHAASAFYGSGFNDSAVLVVDGQGPAGDHLSTTTIWKGSGSRLELVEDINPGHAPFADRSIGHFYSAIAALAGFDHLYAEGKAMALAAYGRPSEFLDLFRQFVAVDPSGRCTVDPALTVSILAHTLGPVFYGWPEPSPPQVELWCRLRRLRTSPEGTRWPTQDDMNIAFAGQAVLEEAMVGLAHRAADLTGSSRLCLAGGVALNCVANERIREAALFEDVYVVPAPADDGQALGKLYTLATMDGLPCPPLTHPFLGPPYTKEDVSAAIDRFAHEFGTLSYLERTDMLERCARLLASGSVVGWFSGRSELGQRALGHRSILADPRDASMRDKLNSIKGREWFRPVAPIVVQEVAGEYFDLKGMSPFMSFAVGVRDGYRHKIPAAVHVDGTARLQTLSATSDERMHGLLREFGKLSGFPILLNTSFNGRNEPIVETPQDAIESFLRLGLDYLAIGDWLLER
jgi:carbamoyltransferase